MTSGVLLGRDHLLVAAGMTRLDAVIVLEMMEHVADGDVVLFASEAAAGVGAFGQIGF
jgi:2-polyprenyl-3-methyl-5-hydroxy-6-metoxy-1,4-benzoquinol methylase